MCLSTVYLVSLQYRTRTVQPSLQSTLYKYLVKPSSRDKHRTARHGMAYIAQRPAAIKYDKSHVNSLDHSQTHCPRDPPPD